MKKLLILFLASAAALAISPRASAGTISGAMTIFGFDTYSASGITFSNPGLAVGSGTLAAGDGLATMTSFSFASAVGKELFSAADGITLTIGSIDVVKDTLGFGGFLDVTGTGTLCETGDGCELADWSLTSTNTGAISFTIDATGTPEPSTLLLLGTGLLGLAFVVFRKSKTVPRLKLQM